MCALDDKLLRIYQNLRKDFSFKKKENYYFYNLVGIFILKCISKL